VSNAIIKSLLEARLETWADTRSPALGIEFKNSPFTPLTGETYLRCYVLPAPTSSDDLAGAMRNYLGVLQISIVTPAGIGEGAAKGIESELDALFPVNLRLTSGAVTVHMITPMSAMSGTPDDGNYTLPVRAQYRADVI
jgi:hypothetical protein